MNVEIKPYRYEDLIKAENNADFFAFLRLHAIGSYLFYCVAKTNEDQFVASRVPVNVTITDEYPPRLIVNGSVVSKGDKKTVSGIVIFHKS